MKIFNHHKNLILSALILCAACSAYSYKDIQRKKTGHELVSKKVYKPAPKKYISYEGQDSWVDSVFSTLSVEQKIGQLFMVAAYSNKEEKHTQEIIQLIEKQNIGGLIFFQGGPIRQALLTNLYQSRAKVPLLISLDAEWGLAMRLDSTRKYPRQMMLGAIQNNELIYQMGCDIAEQCKKIGVHVSFSPVLDINNNASNPVINSRSFGELKENVAQKGIAYMQGLQDGNILANGKHFPGHGDTDKDSHKTLPSVEHSAERLDSLELYPFKKAIEYGLGSVMVAHLNMPNIDSAKNSTASLSSNVIQKLLKDKMNFKGLVFTDALNMKGVSGYFEPGEVNLKALLAGNDVLLFPENVPQAIEVIKNAIDSGLISQQEIDLRCKKILHTKKWAGLNHFGPINTQNLYEQLHPKSHELTLRKLIESSITVLKNDHNIIPIQHLDTLSILQIAIGASGAERNYFQERLSSFAKIDFYPISKNPSETEQKDLLLKIKSYNLVLISIHQTNEQPSKNFGVTENAISLSEKIAQEKASVLHLFGNPYALNYWKKINNFSAIMVSYEDDSLTQDYTAQALMGSFACKGKTPVSTGGFKAGWGIETPAIQRLKYTIPEELHIPSYAFEKIDSIAQSSIAGQVFPGCQILVAKEGKVIYHKSFGKTSYESNLPVKLNHVYDIASITKIASSLVTVMQLQDLGLLDLDGKLKDYIPDLVKGTPYASLNLREILAHQAGLVSWIPFYQQTLDKSGGVKKEYYSATLSEEFPTRVAENLYIRQGFVDTLYQRIIQTPLEKKEYKYSDLGYYLIQAAIEKQTGLKLDQYVNMNIYSKLGMTRTHYNPRQFFSLDEIIPTEFDKDFRKQLIHGDVHDPGAAMMGGVAGHAGLFSNANDLAKIMQMYLNFGSYGGEEFIRETTVQEFAKCQYCKDNRRGAGFDKPTKPGENGPTCDCVSFDSFGHTGFTGTLAWADPDEKIVYIFLSNRVNPDANNKKILTQNTRSKIMRVIFDAVQKYRP